MMPHATLLQRIRIGAWLPLMISAGCLLFYPIHFEFFWYHLTPEDGLVEYLTALSAFAACGLAGYAAWRSWQLTPRSLEWMFLALFALGALFFAGEEISWGQRIFGIKTENISPWLNSMNRQGEMNIHNIKGIANLVRLVADGFCLFWGIFIPWFYSARLFPIVWLRRLQSPVELIPAFVTTLAITWPQKIYELFWGEAQWVSAFRLGEFKELCFGLACFLYAFYMVNTLTRKSGISS